MGRPRSRNQHLPDRVYFKHGAYYYVEPGSERWVRVGSRLHEVRAKVDGHHQAVSRQRRFRGCVKGWASTAVSQARRRSKARGTPCDLTVDAVMAMYERAGGRCELTGIPFDNEFGHREFRARPWMPSIDRIDPKGPYLSENCRVVCYAVNSALNEYGVELLIEIARGLMRTRVFANRRKNLPAQPEIRKPISELKA